jgi:hypothetical protein
MNASCIVCGGSRRVSRHDYVGCADCGHQELRARSAQTYIVNDPLETGDADRVMALDRFKNSTLRRWMRGNGTLVDFGSASGRFLHQNAGEFRSVIGVEVTAEAAEFSRRDLGLDIRATVDSLPAAIDVVTFWHSLEHVPAQALRGVVNGVAARLGGQGRVIVSVPNARSLQYWALGRRYAFYDVPNHHHQFSMQSLDLLMASAGLTREALTRSWVYNLFGWVQGAINVIGGGHNHLYYRLKRRTGPDKLPLTMAHILLLPLVAVPALMLAVVDAAWAQRQGVITACYARNRS